MANIIDGSRLFMDRDKLLSLEFNETISSIIDKKVDILEEVALKFETSSSDGERDALAILMRAEMKTLEILKKFKDKSEEDLKNM